MRRYPRPFVAFAVSAIMGLMPFSAGCGGVSDEPLMPTPALYTEVGLDPFAELDASRQTTNRRIFYATSRERKDDRQRVDYGTRLSEDLSLGVAVMSFGDGQMDWPALAEASRAADREAPVMTSLDGVIELGKIPKATGAPGAAQRARFELFRESLAGSVDDSAGDVIVWVHGASGNLYNVLTFAAEFDHFMGRDFTPIAYSWPSHEQIISYGLREDLRSALGAGEGLATLLELLATQTEARRIHVVTWSAGGRVVNRAMEVLDERLAGLDADERRERMRLGVIYYAAADLPRRELEAALEAHLSLADRIIITMASDDAALDWARRMMGGDRRIGDGDAVRDASAEDVARWLGRVEVLDVSEGREERGFDLAGHHYWHEHPWASTDLILAIRGNLPADRRGLAQGRHPLVWRIPADYVDRVRAAVE